MTTTPLYGIRTRQGWATRTSVAAPVTFTDNVNLAYSFKAEAEAAQAMTYLDLAGIVEIIPAFVMKFAD